MVSVDVTRNTNISNDNRIVSKFSSLIITCAPDIDQQVKEVLQSIRANFQLEFFSVTESKVLVLSVS